MGEDSLGFGGMAIISLQSCGGWLQNWGSKFIPNQGEHNARGCPLIHYALVHNQILDRHRYLKGDGGWHAQFSILHVECDQLRVGGVYGPKGS